MLPHLDLIQSDDQATVLSTYKCAASDRAVLPGVSTTRRRASSTNSAPAALTGQTEQISFVV